MATKSHPELTWDEEIRNHIADLCSNIDRVKLHDGRRDYIAGSRDVEHIVWDVKLTAPTADQIELEMDEHPDGYSETLELIRQSIERETGAYANDDWTMTDAVDHAVISVEAQRDHRLRRTGKRSL